MGIEQEAIDKFNDSDYFTQVSVVFVACARRICLSELSSEIKADAMGMAMRFYRSNIAIEMADRVFEAQSKTGEPLDRCFAVLVQGMIEKSQKDEQHLKNIMELFKD